jgi:methionyl-tRNA formyltransferase
LRDERGDDGLSVVVLSCSDLGIEVANSLHAQSFVREVLLVTAPSLRRPQSLRQKIKALRRAEGLRGLAVLPLRKASRLVLGRRRGADPGAAPALVLDAGIAALHFADFESVDCRHAIRERSPDLGVIAGTYILSAEVFGIPRLESINLHSGKAPEYRGAAPAFWELYNGEEIVGITIHRVLAAVDAGAILRQELFPLDSAPDEDPIAYIERYRRTVLRPNGVRMLVAAVGDIARGDANDQEQDSTRAKTYRTPDYAAVREVRRRVAARRRDRQS